MTCVPKGKGEEHKREDQLAFGSAVTAAVRVTQPVEKAGVPLNQRRDIISREASAEEPLSNGCKKTKTCKGQHKEHEHFAGCVGSHCFHLNPLLTFRIWYELAFRARLFEFDHGPLTYRRTGLSIEGKSGKNDTVFQ